MNIVVHDYRCGKCILQEEQFKIICSLLSDCTPSKSETSASNIRKKILAEFQKDGWSDKYRLAIHSGITISAKKNNIGLCLQTGNVSRMYADMLKLQALYLKGKIQVGLVLLPDKETANLLGQNIANYERFTGELAIFEQVISMPLVVIGFSL